MAFEQLVAEAAVKKEKKKKEKKGEASVAPDGAADAPNVPRTRAK